MSRQRPKLSEVEIVAQKGAAVPAVAPGAPPLMEDAEREFGREGEGEGAPASPSRLSVVPPPAPPAAPEPPAPASQLVPVSSPPPAPIGIALPQQQNLKLVGVRISQPVEKRLHDFASHYRVARQTVAEVALDLYLKQHGF